ncbi:MAG: hypothetical protein HYZ69_03035, partial [Candidatus Colwellbacteria bacterium]|nr:hypothetical protein [Candidatus Colwellbacteria bacterium]
TTRSAFQIYDGTNPRFMVNQDGTVGLGTTSPGSILSIDRVGNFVQGATSSLYTALNLPHLYSTSTSATSTFAGSLYVASSTPTQNALFAVGTSSPLLFIDRNSGYVAVGTPSPVTNALFTVGTSSSLFVDKNNGNVGIGQTDPGTELEIKASSPAIRLRENSINAIYTMRNNAGSLEFNPASSAATVTITAAGNVIITGNCSDAAGGGGCTADYAEVYHRDPADFMEKGDLLALNIETGKITRADRTNSSHLVGSFSSAPGSLIGQRKNSIQLGVGKGVLDGLDPDEIPVAMVGRVPVKVSTESGPIKIGDRITSSSLAGVGMKATKDGYTVGIALESFDLVRHPEPCEGSQGDSSVVRLPQNDAEVCVGKILVFVNLGYSKLDDNLQGLTSAGGETLTTNAFFIDQTTGKLTASFTAGLDLKDNSLENVSKILSSNGSWSIDENGKLAVKEIKTDALEIGSPEKPQGVTIYDKFTGEPVCVLSENKALVLKEGKCE